MTVTWASRVHLQVDRAWRRWLGGASAGLFAALALCGCAELPAVGPTIGEIEKDGNTLSTAPFVIVDIDRQVVRMLEDLRPKGFAGHFVSRAPRPNLKIAIGDTIQINVLEQVPGLFSTPVVSTLPQTSGGIAPSVPVVVQPIQVGSDGALNVPFAGRIVAAGRTSESVRAEIEHKLESKAIFPQVQVSILGGGAGLSANSATVGGEVGRAGLFPLQPSGTRLLDLIAEAGGARFPAYETTVYLTRNGQRREASLQNVIENSKENVYIYPRDDIYLSRLVRTFSVLGASSKVGRYGFETAHVNLAEAVAIGGGFVDTTADPAGVYVFRYEPPSFVRALRPQAEVLEGEPTPVLYRMNLRSGDGYFLSTKFEMHDRDIILLANSNGAQFQKLLNILQTGTSIALTAKTLAQPNSVVLTTLSTAPTGGAAQ